LDRDDPTVWQEALDTATREIAFVGKNLASGGVGSAASFQNQTANAFMLLDTAAERLHEWTGLSKGDALKRLERIYRDEANRLATTAERLGGASTTAKALQIMGSLPLSLLTAGAASLAAGPVAGFAGLGALSEADKGAKAAALGAVEGALVGKIFKGSEGVGKVKRAAGIATAGSGMGLARGEAPEDAVLGGMTLGTLSAIGGGKPGLPRVRPIKTAAEGQPKPLQTRPERADYTKGPARAPAAEGGELVHVTPRTHAAAAEFLGRDYSELEIPDKVVNLNLKRIKGPDDFKRAVSELVDIFRGEINEARRKQITHEQTAQMAEDLGMSVEQLLARRKGASLNAEEITAARVLNRTVLEQWKAAADAMRSGRATDQDKAEFIRLTGLAEASLQQTLGATAEAGRALSAMRIEVGPSARQMRGIKDAIKEFRAGSGSDVETFADAVSAIDTPQGLARFALEARKATTAEKFLEVWVNSLLSGPQTHAVNTLSNELVSYYTVPETYLAGAIGAVRSGTRAAVGKAPPAERVYLREGTQRLFAIAQSGGEGLRLAGKAFFREQPSDPLSKVELQRFQSIGGRIGKAVRIPGRALLAEDEFYKARGRRQELNALAVRDGIEQGKSGRELARHIRAFIENPPEAAVEASVHAARIQTFTEPLGRVGKGAQELFSHPIGRLIAPFIRTPTNIAKFAAHRSPFGLAMKDVQAEIKAGGARRDMAIARMGFSSAIGAWVATQAASGNITGSGPSDPEARRVWFAAGYRPYSVRIPAWVADEFGIGEQGETGDAWVSFARLEPIGTILGVSADFAEISGHIKEKGAEELGAKIVMAVNKNLTNKTFLQGLSRLALAVSDPDRYAPRLIQGFAGTVIPTAVAQVARVQDPVLREVRSALDQIKSRIPGYSDELPARRNIWGEPIILDGGLGPDLVSPLYSHRVVPDKASREVARLSARLSKPSRQIAGVDLTPKEYGQLQQLTGQRAKRVIDLMVHGIGWDGFPDGLQREMIEDEYENARRLAREEMESRMRGRSPGRFRQVVREGIEMRYGR
jgi:hypothetical protein